MGSGPRTNQQVLYCSAAVRVAPSFWSHIAVKQRCKTASGTKNNTVESCLGYIPPGESRGRRIPHEQFRQVPSGLHPTQGSRTKPPWGPVVAASRPGEYRGGRIPHTTTLFSPVVVGFRTKITVESRGKKIPRGAVPRTKTCPGEGPGKYENTLSMAFSTVLVELNPRCRLSIRISSIVSYSGAVQFFVHNGIISYVPRTIRYRTVRCCLPLFCLTNGHG